MKTRTCKNCGEEKLYEKGSWRWAARYGAYGRVCLSCHIHNDRPNNTRQHAQYRNLARNCQDEAMTVAKENAYLKKQLKKLLKELESDY
jgi:hypothetical protein